MKCIKAVSRQPAVVLTLEVLHPREVFQLCVSMPASSYRDGALLRFAFLSMFRQQMSLVRCGCEWFFLSSF